MHRIVVDIPVAATWPSTEELSARDAVIDELNGLGIGTCTGAGGGRGAMDFSYRVADLETARSSLERAMRSHLNGYAFSIQISE